MVTTNRIKRIENDSEIVEYGKDYIKYEDGSCYYGETKEIENKDPLMNGFGKIEFFNGECYEGECKDNKFHGKGTYSLSDGVVLYEGSWKNSKINGQGRYLYIQDNVIYDGEWKDNTRNGYGKLISMTGIIIYEGEWKDDMKNGFGTSICKELYENGEFYEEEYIGEWLNDKKTGKGIMKIKGYWDNDRVISKNELQNCKNMEDFMNNLNYNQNNMPESYYNMFPPGEVYEFY